MTSGGKIKLPRKAQIGKLFVRVGDKMVYLGSTCQTSKSTITTVLILTTRSNTYNNLQRVKQ